MTPNLTAGVDTKLRQLADATGDRAADKDAVRRLAQEFEAMLMTQMLREMRRSMLDEDEESEGFGSAALTDTGDVELGRALSAKGGFGLTEALLSVFERQVVTPAAADAQSGAQPVVAAPAPTEPAPTSPVASTPVNSRFGWRRDPITGSPKFHNGVDIAAAYGSNVEAAGGGRVVFSGVQGTYGQTILIDHGNGRQTRYAHLSERLVQAGDAVQGGQVVGRTGSSGRSTGPHLHFEVLVNGTPVDPQASVNAGGRAGGGRL